MTRWPIFLALAKLLPFVIPMSLIQGCVMQGQAISKDQPAVARYVSGWQQNDGAKVQSAFSPNGVYKDPSLPGTVGGPHIAAHVAAHQEARFELLEVREIAKDQLELRWKALWPKRQFSIEYLDKIKINGGLIEIVDSTSAPSPEAVRLVADYEVLHDTPTPERLQKLLTKDVEIYGSTLPPSGLRYDTYPGFLEKLRGTAFRQLPDAPLTMTKDGRIVLRWTLSGGGKRLAAGVDYLTIEQGRIRKIVGVY
jgi:hypothetical protein